MNNQKPTGLRRSLIALAASAVSTLAATLSPASTLIVLPLPTGASGTPYATCVNLGGTVVGYSSAGLSSRPIKWTISGSTATASTLPLLSGFSYGYAYGINDSGNVVGYCGGGPKPADNRAFYYNGTTTSALATTTSDGYPAYPSFAYSIDNGNYITGTLGRFSSTSPTAYAIGPSMAFVATPTTTTDYRPTYPAGVIAQGVGATGYHIVATSTGHAITGYGNYYDAGFDSYNEPMFAQATPFNTFGFLQTGQSAFGYGANATGTVVGYINSTPKTQAFVRYSAGSLTILGNGVARSINASGTCVGWLTLGGANHAFRWTSSGGVTDLNSDPAVPSGKVLNDAYCVNDNGWIVGTGTDSVTGAFAYLLKP